MDVVALKRPQGGVREWWSNGVMYVRPNTPFPSRAARGSYAAFAESFFRLIAGIDSTGQGARATTFSVTLPINM